jgi:predicted RNA binding protein YcfA (HicA-like mRNA interferase family)
MSAAGAVSANPLLQTKSFAVIGGLTPRERPAVLLAIQRLREEFADFERERGAPRVDHGAPGSASDLIQALAKPLFPGQRGKNLKLLEAEEGGRKRGAEVAAKAVIPHSTSIYIDYSEHEENLFAAICQRWPIANFINIADLFCLDIFAQLKNALDEFKDCAEIKELIQFLVEAYATLYLASTKPFTEGCMTRFSSLGKSYQFSNKGDGKKFLDQMMLLDQMIDKVLQGFAALALVTKGSKPAKAGQLALKLKKEKAERAIPVLKRIKEVIALLIKVPPGMDPLAFYIKGSYFGPNPNKKDLALCLQNLNHFGELSTAAIQHFLQTSLGDLKKGQANFVLKQSATRAFELKQLVRTKLFDVYSEFNSIGAKFAAKEREIQTGTVSQKNILNSQFCYELAVCVLFADFLFKFEVILDTLVVEPLFPHFTPQVMHFIKACDRFELFYQIVKAARSPSDEVAMQCQLIIETQTKMAIHDEPNFLLVLESCRHSFEKNDLAGKYLTFGRCFPAFQSLIKGLKSFILPKLDAFRLKLLEAAALKLKACSLEELQEGREQLKEALLPINTKAAEELCHFVLFIKRIENFTSALDPGQAKAEDSIVPVELVNYLTLDGIDELIDCLIAEKRKAALDAAPVPAKPKADAPAAAAAKAPPPAALAAPASLRIARGDKFQTVLNRLKEMGYEVKRQRGSHLILARLHEGRENSVVLPKHPQFTRGTAQSVEKQANREK